MTVGRPHDDPDVTEPRLMLDDPASEFESEGAVPAEGAAPAEGTVLAQWDEPAGQAPLLVFEPSPALPIAAKQDTAPLWRRPSKGRAFSGTVMLGVGLVAGFAGGTAITQKLRTESAALVSSLAPTQQDSPRTDTQVQPPGDPEDDEVVVQQTDEPKPAAEPVATTSVPVPASAGRPVSAKPVSRNAGPAVASLYVQSRPAGAHVYLDDHLVSTTPFQLSGISPGQHTLRLDLDGYRSWSAPVTVEPGGHVRIAASLEQ